MAEPRRAQNYIPISGRGRQPSGQQHYRTEGNLAVEIERRAQKKPESRETNARPAPRAKNNQQYNNRIETVPGRKAPLKNAGSLQRGTAERTAPVRQSAAAKQTMPRASAPARETRMNRPAAQVKQKTAQGYRSIMQSGSVSMRGEMAIPMPQTRVRVKPEKAKAPSIKAQAAPRPQGLVSTILLIVFVFGVLSFLLMRTATLSNIGLQNDTIQKNITTLSQNLDKTKLDVTMQDDISSIQQRAQQLNMGVPGSGQITYLPADNTAKAETPAASNTQTADSSKDTSLSLNSLFKEIKSWFG